jgi:glycosyltransferase involved in cell wall biosynthesis
MTELTTVRDTLQMSAGSDGQHMNTPNLRPHLLCIGGEDHSYRIPFLLALRDKGFQVSAAGTSDSSPFAQAGIDYHPFHCARFVDPLSDWAALKTMSKLIADIRPALVQCFDTKLNVLVPFAASGLDSVKVVSTINGLGWLYSSRSLVALGLRPVYRVLQRWAARWTAVTVFQNRDDRTFFMRHRMVGKGCHLVIPGSGIDIGRFQHAATTGSSAAELREALGLGASKVVVTVTRMTRQKGIPTLLDAAALVHQRQPDVRFLLVGPRESEGPSAVTQAEIDHHAPYVVAVGPRTDVPALLGIADVFALPTEYLEGVPRALLEAAAVGCPIVTTRMPGCTDVIRDGWNGFLVPPRDPQRLAERILDQLSDRVAAAEMGVRAAQLVRTEFNLEITVARYAAVYKELCRSVVAPVWSSYLSAEA